MSYNTNIPQGTDPRSKSQRQILANFQAIQEVWGANHVPLTSTNNVGMHSVVTMRPQPIPPNADPTTTSTQVALYNKQASSIPALFFRPNSSQTPIKLTYPSIKADSSTTQYSFIAGPFIIYGGSFLTPANGKVVTLTPGTSLLYVGLQVVNGPGPVAIATSINTPANSFTISYNGSFGTTGLVYYLAIGN
jgi:hypothetical protein